MFAAAFRTPEALLSAAVDALQSPRFPEVLDRLDAPIYVTDAEGRVTFYNRGCVEFAGRTPTVGEDRWCVTWRLFTKDGRSLPHDECPMAVAIREKRPVRGVEAVAERPDGSRVRFRPYPTPLLDREGRVVGAVNLLVDLSGPGEAQALRDQATRCRRLAAAMVDRSTRETLEHLAAEYEQKAAPPAPLN